MAVTRPETPPQPHHCGFALVVELGVKPSLKKAAKVNSKSVEFVRNLRRR